MLCCVLESKYNYLIKKIILPLSTLETVFDNLVMICIEYTIPLIGMKP